MISGAAGGPSLLLPHQRGMVAHMAATQEGARRLATADAITSDWLNVLDPLRRYGDPGQADPYDEESSRFDPFEAFGLDSDSAPPASNPDDRFERREVPADAWDLFASTGADRERLPIEAVGQLRGAGSLATARLPMRLWQLGMLLVRVANQPASLWWASHQRGIHPDVASHLEWALRQNPDRFSPTLRRGWRHVLSAWRTPHADPNRTRYVIEAQVRRDGWSTETVRFTIAMYTPIVTVRPPFGKLSPAEDQDLKLAQIVRLDVEYPRPHEPLVIPDDHLAYAVALFRAQIEHAVVIERELSGDGQIYFDTTRADDGASPDEDGFRLTGHLATFINLMTRLVVADRSAARAEIHRWPTDDGQVFTRLRIWAASQPALLGPAEAAEIFLSLDDEAFWTDQHERDLLYALRDRWGDMSDEERGKIEQRLLTTAFPWPSERDDLARINAHYRLNRLQWLHVRGVAFGFDLADTIARIRMDAPDWEERFADHAAQPKVGPVRSITTQVDPEAVIDLPLKAVLAEARAAASFDFSSDVERRPFLGLAEQRPARALAVLTDAARRGEFAEREWAALLNASSRGDVSTRVLRAIAHRLSRLTPKQVAGLRHPISEWLSDRAVVLFGKLPTEFDLVWNSLAVALSEHPPADRFRRDDEGWVDDGLNQPAGRMVDALLKDPARNDFEAGNGLSAEWRIRLDQLFELPGDARRHAIAMISPHTNWLHAIDPEWTGRQLLALADRDDIDSRAFWGGYFWAGRTPSVGLYMRLKDSFIALARSGPRRRDHANKLAGMLLAGWAGDEDVAESNALIPDVELREILIHADDDLRTQMLWYVERWTKEPGSRWGERLLPFLRDVWPRQIAVRTPRTSSRLVDLALGLPARFPEIVETILPRLGPIVGSDMRMGPFVDIEEGVATTHPRHLLDLLWAVLPRETDAWPYEIGKVLEALALQDAVRDDARLKELRRRLQGGR